MYVSLTRLLRTIRAVLTTSRYFHDHRPAAGPGGGCTPTNRAMRPTIDQNHFIAVTVPCVEVAKYSRCVTLATTDLTDAYPDLDVAEPVLRDFGGADSFAGPIETVRVFEDNVLVRATLETPGHGRVLVVDGGGSRRRALVGDVLAGIAIASGWAGIIINGCVRDTAVTRTMDIGLKALAALPKRSDKFGHGQVSVPVRFAGVDFVPGHWVYADVDGIVVAPHQMQISD